MTLEQTRQLGIEFERRVQVMIPQKEFSEKLDTETIYSFLNQYQDKLIHDIYKSLDNIASPSKPSAYVETILQGLLSNVDISLKDSDYHACIFEGTLPEDFGLYLNSFTQVQKAYSYKDNVQNEGLLSNVLVSRSDLAKYMSTTYDSMRILRNPIVCFDTKDRYNNRRINLLCDKYTDPLVIRMDYYRIPSYMNLMTSSPCELPMDAFEDLVSGSVDLYVQYVSGAEERRKKQIQQA